MIFKVGATPAQETIGWYSADIALSNFGYLQTRNWNHWSDPQLTYEIAATQTNKSLIDYNKSTSFGQIKDVEIPVCWTVFHFWLRMVLNAIFGGISIKGETPFYHEMKFWLL